MPVPPVGEFMTRIPPEPTGTPLENRINLLAKKKFKDEISHDHISVLAKIKYFFCWHLSRDLIRVLKESQDDAAIQNAVKILKVSGKQTSILGSMLRDASERGDLPTVQRLLKYCDLETLHSQDRYSRTALHLVCGRGNPSVQKNIVEELLLREKELRGPGGKSLITIEAKDGQTPMHLACYYGNKEVVDELILHGGLDQLYVGSMDRHEKIHGSLTPLHLAAEEGHAGTLMLIRSKERLEGNVDAPFCRPVKSQGRTFYQPIRDPEGLTFYDYIVKNFDELTVIRLTWETRLDNAVRLRNVNDAENIIEIAKKDDLDGDHYYHFTRSVIDWMMQRTTDFERFGIVVVGLIEWLDQQKDDATPPGPESCYQWPLKVAAGAGNVAAVNFVIEIAGKEVSKKSALQHACASPKGKIEDVVDILFDDTYDANATMELINALLLYVKNHDAFVDNAVNALNRLLNRSGLLVDGQYRKKPFPYYNQHVEGFRYHWQGMSDEKRRKIAQSPEGASLRKFIESFPPLGPEDL